MSLKRFAFVIKDLYGGGAEKSLIDTADGLRQRGHDVRVFILRDKIEHRVPDGLDVVNLALINDFTKAISNVIVEKWQANRIGRALDLYQPDIVLSCACDKITRHLQNRNLYFWVKSDETTKFSDPKKQKKAFAKVRRFYNGRKVIAVSQGVRDSLLGVIGLQPAEIRVIYNPFERQPLENMAQEPTDLPQRDYLIHAGAYEPRKRQDRLLRAYKASGVTTPLYLLGKGKPENESKLRSLITEMGLEDRVTMQGFVTNPYPFIANAKGLILTSDAEGLGRVLIEALLLGTPIVSVDCPSGPSEILTGKLQAFLTPVDDEAALADAIARMDQSPVMVTSEYTKPFLKETVLPQFERL